MQKRIPTTASPRPQLIPRPGVQFAMVVSIRPRFSRRLGRGCRTALALACAAVVLLGSSPGARASLGSNVSSVETDRAQMHAQMHPSVNAATQQGNYHVQQMELPGGTVVNEYVAPSGQVFAVTWHGQFLPPMQQILGDYFQQYTAALQARPATFGHRPLNIQQSGLVVQTSGHMRAHSGRAYIPSLVPQGVSLNQIQ